jgi:mRNA interferase MazF
MQSTTGYNRGDIILVNFVFTEGSGARRRPAVVLSSDDYHWGRQEAIIAAITSNTGRLLVGDHLISDWQNAGLLFPSVATGIIRTIKQTMIIRRLGIISSSDMQAIEGRLKISLGLV